MLHDMYVMHSRKGWTVREEGQTRPWGVFQSRTEAANEAQKRARLFRTNLIIYDSDGTTWVGHN